MLKSSIIKNSKTLFFGTQTNPTLPAPIDYFEPFVSKIDNFIREARGHNQVNDMLA
jgi:hypothetical protein